MIVRCKGSEGAYISHYNVQTTKEENPRHCRLQ
jgi:hypothetical protein